ncbi:sterol desaturase [Thalassotalea insulae]|uniref:Sterol desaturase n=1 Tax=Thalassotalea insulae TaxID=2056778 RepID=A0ABQ6GVK7_9GAMM|nr:sterol desaturase family protein [Thalassotalea insulae]GLX78691.1 sterol desaturase [Thalassotalea insulae]
MGFILAAIPFFLLAIAIELWFDKRRATGYYQFNDAINSLQLGTLSRIIGLLKAAIPFSLYTLIYQNYALWQLPESSLLVWLFAFIAYDLGYYWVHRLSHRINVMWASHVVHHSSEEYNLTTALRQTSTPALFAWAILLPLAFFGISPMLLISCGALNLIYQFWVHTRHIDKMPAWFEAIMVTPSHHRVHHALNRDYIDKNYAGVFILWDKLFGSFQAEKDNINIVYGVSHQLKSWNPIWANFKVYRDLLTDTLNTQNWRDKFQLWFRPPGWRPQDVTDTHPRPWVTTKSLIKYDNQLSYMSKAYILFQFVITIALSFFLLLSASNFSLLTNVLLCGIAMFCLFATSTLQEQKPASFLFETLRIILVSSTVAYFSPAEIQGTVGVVTLCYCLISLMGLLILKRKQQRQTLSLAPTQSLANEAEN